MIAFPQGPNLKKGERESRIYTTGGPKKEERVRKRGGVQLKKKKTETGVWVRYGRGAFYFFHLPLLFFSSFLFFPYSLPLTLFISSSFSNSESL